MINIIVFGALSWLSLIGMTAVLLNKARKIEDERHNYSLIKIVQFVLTATGEKVAEYSKRRFFNFLRIILAVFIRGYRVVQKVLTRYHTLMTDYVDGKINIKDKRASSIYLKSISVHKEDVKKGEKVV